MQFSLFTVSDLSLLLAFSAIILLIMASLPSSFYGLKNLMINKKKLQTAALTVGTLFLATIMYIIISMVT